MMSVSDDTVFVDSADANDREPSVEILCPNSDEQDMSGEREDIVQASEAVKNVKAAIKYSDDESLQEALDKVRERPRIDAEFQEKITILQSLLDVENYSAFHDVVEEVIGQLADAQETAKKGKTSLSRPIEILNEVLPVFEKACLVYTEKVESSPRVNQILRELERIRLELKECERIESADIDKAKKLEKKGEKMLEEAVQHSIDDVERVKGKITEEKEAGILTWFENTRTEQNNKMIYLTTDFEDMKNNCVQDIQLIENTRQIEIESKESALAKFEAKDKKLEEEIRVKLEREEMARRQLEEIQEERKALEEEREIRRQVQNKADVVHKQAEDELQQMSTNLNDLLAKVDTADVVLKQTKDVCNRLFNKAVESKNLQNQDLEDVLLLTKKNRHNALIAQGVNCLSIQERERGTIEMLKDKIKKKTAKLQDVLRKRLASEANKLKEKIKTMTSDLETSKRTLEKVNEKLLILKQQISDIQRELDAAGMTYASLQQNYEDYKKINEGDDLSLTSMPSIS